MKRQASLTMASALLYGLHGLPFSRRDLHSGARAHPDATQTTELHRSCGGCLFYRLDFHRSRGGCLFYRLARAHALVSVLCGDCLAPSHFRQRPGGVGCRAIPAAQRCRSVPGVALH